MVTEEQLTKCLEEIKRHLSPAFIILFGSYSKNAQREESDMDLAYFSEVTLTAYERFALTGDLANILGIEVDLIDIKTIDTVFCMQIFSEGRLVDCRDENEFVKQRMKAYSMYMTLNEQRATIIRNIKERGSVFGE